MYNNKKLTQSYKLKNNGNEQNNGEKKKEKML